MAPRDIVYGTTLGIELPKDLAAASTRCDGLVLTAAPDVEARHPGAIALVAEVATPQTLWVLPGALADRVRADGTLVATGQRALPEGARSARLAVRSAPARLASGARAALELEVAHPGGPPAWQADALHPVEVTASWVPRGRFGPVLGVARAVLGRDVAPGASLPLALDVRAADRDGGGLPAGSYDLLLRVEERGIGAFPTAAAPPVRVPVAVG